MKPISTSRVWFVTISIAGAILHVAELFFSSHDARLYQVLSAVVFCLVLGIGLPSSLPNSKYVSRAYRAILYSMLPVLLVAMVSQIILDCVFLYINKDVIDFGIVSVGRIFIRLSSFGVLLLCAAVIAHFTGREEKRCQV